MRKKNAAVSIAMIVVQSLNKTVIMDSDTNPPIVDDSIMGQRESSISSFPVDDITFGYTVMILLLSKRFETDYVVHNNKQLRILLADIGTTHQ